MSDDHRSTGPASQLMVQPGVQQPNRLMSIVWKASTLVGLVASSLIIYEIAKWDIEERKARRATSGTLKALPGYARPGYATGYLDGMSAARAAMMEDDLSEAFPGAR